MERRGHSTMKQHLVPLSFCFVGAMILLSAVPVNAARSNTAPRLRIVHKSGFKISIKGSGWASKSRVTFSVNQGLGVEGLELLTSSSGTFIVGIRHIDLCHHSAFTSRDLTGHTATLHVSTRACATRSPEPVPELKVLKGSCVGMSVTHVDGPAHPAVVINLGNAIYIWQPGAKHPAYLPAAPFKYFDLLDRGTTQQRACPETECAAGFYWEWAALTSGTTGITMTPWCARKKPACLTPTYVIRVRIVTPGH